MISKGPTEEYRSKLKSDIFMDHISMKHVLFLHLQEITLDINPPTRGILPHANGQCILVFPLCPSYRR